MDYLLNRYKSYCDSILKPLNFKFHRSGNTYARIVNNMVQGITMERISQGHECRVEFAVFPLCAGFDRIGGTRYLRQFEKASRNSPYDAWEYNKSSTESMDRCTYEINRFIESYLLPLFEKTTDSSTAFQELVLVDELFYHNRISSFGTPLTNAEQKNSTQTVYDINFSDASKYYLALMNGNYSYAIRSNMRLQKIAEEALKQSRSLGSPEKYINECETSLKELSCIIQRLEENDRTYFQSILKRNEEYSKEKLKMFL